MTMKTPEELADEWANKEGDLWFADISTYTDGHKSAVKQGFLAGYQAAASQWISVKDRLPEDENDYLLAFRIKGFWEHLIEVDRFWFGHRGWDVPNSYEVLAWMPLPKPPEES